MISHKTLRFCAAAVALSLGAVAALPAAHAQAPDAVTEVARAKYKDGVKAYEAGKFDDARAAFLQAYALKRVPAVLLNLGQSELRTVPPHYEDAGNHLQQFLHEHKTASPDERAAAEKGVAEVRKKSSWIVITCDTMGAEVSVDGQNVGQSPLGDAIFVRPGKHIVTGAFSGKTVNEAVESKLGAPIDVSLRLGAAAPPPVVAPVPVPVAPVPPPPLPPEAKPEPPVAPPPQAEGQSFFDWYKNKPFAWVTTGVAGVGLVGGIAFTAASGAAASTTNGAATDIRAHLKGGAGAPCATDGSGGTDAPGFSGPCQTLRDDVSAYHTDVALGVTGWVLFGVGSIATVTYALVDWYPNRNKAPTTGAGPSNVAFTPVITPQFQGLGVAGKF